MTELTLTLPQLAAGDVLTLEEFLERWEQLPDLRRAELIEGVVYMPSPMSQLHLDMESCVHGWLWMYAAATPGCRDGGAGTFLMGGEAPQPDGSLRILPEYGGRVGLRGALADGAPELIVEVCLTSAAYDLHQKRRTYERAEVEEYAAVLLHPREVRWMRRSGGKLPTVAPDEDGIFRSTAFPGLWLDPQALLAFDKPRVLAVLQQGLAAPEHAAFVAKLAERRRAAEAGE